MPIVFILETDHVFSYETLVAISPVSLDSSMHLATEAVKCWVLFELEMVFSVQGHGCVVALVVVGEATLLHATTLWFKFLILLLREAFCYALDGLVLEQLTILLSLLMLFINHLLLHGIQHLDPVFLNNA